MKCRSGVFRSTRHLPQTVTRRGLLLAIPVLGAAYVHLRWLPAQGVNGWTGELKERYLELVTKRRGAADGEA